MSPWSKQAAKRVAIASGHSKPSPSMRPPGATPKQVAFIRKLDPNRTEASLYALTMRQASVLIDGLLGKKPLPYKAEEDPVRAETWGSMAPTANTKQRAEVRRLYPDMTELQIAGLTMHEAGRLIAQGKSATAPVK